MSLLRPPRPGRGAPDEAGFSLVELLVAIFLFGVVLTALTGVFVASAESINDQRLRTEATRVAADHLETLRGVPFDQLDAEAGRTTVTTPQGRTFVVDTSVTAIDANTGLPVVGGRVKRLTAVVSWSSGDATRSVTYTTAVGAGPPAADVVSQAIGTVTMFPSPATTSSGDGLAKTLQGSIEVTVPLTGFPAQTLVGLTWTNALGTIGSRTLTSTSGLNWRTTIPGSDITAAIVGGQGEVGFTVSAGTLVARYTLAVQSAAAVPPAITAAAIDRSPVTVARPSGGRTCADRNQCQNTSAVTFTATAANLDPAQDAIIVQYQLFDGTFVEAPLTPPAVAGGQWALTVGQRTTKFLPGTARAFRFSAIRSSDGASASATVTRDVVAT